MKKILSLILAALMLFVVFTGCEKVEDKDNSSVASKPTVQLVELASKGKIPEMQFGIGAGVDEVKEYYNNQIANDPQAAEVLEYTVDEYTKIDLGAFAYYYETENKEGGIVGVTSVDKAFGFSMNLALLEDVLAVAGENAVETLATDSELFFIPGGAPEGAKKIYLTAGEYELKLFFFNGYLTAVSLF